MLLRNLHILHIHPIHIPPSLNPLLRQRTPVAILPVAPLPFHPVMGILVLIPELHGDLVPREAEEFFA